MSRKIKTSFVMSQKISRLRLMPASSSLPDGSFLFRKSRTALFHRTHILRGSFRFRTTWGRCQPGHLTQVNLQPEGQFFGAIDAQRASTPEKVLPRQPVRPRKGAYWKVDEPLASGTVCTLTDLGAAANGCGAEHGFRGSDGEGVCVWSGDPQVVTSHKLA
jgi:hypothetical protein